MVQNDAARTILFLREKFEWSFALYIWKQFGVAEMSMRRHFPAMPVSMAISITLKELLQTRGKTMDFVSGVTLILGIFFRLRVAQSGSWSTENLQALKMNMKGVLESTSVLDFLNCQNFENYQNRQNILNLWIFQTFRIL